MLRRLQSLGMPDEKLFTAGNLKFDAEPGSDLAETTDEIRERFGLQSEVPLILAASTHAPEEEIILESFKQLRTKQPARLMIAPRHPERFNEVASLIQNSGLSWTRRTNVPEANDTEATVILLDTIGELPATYSLATVVFVGGSIVDRGGHNVLEPAAAGAAVVTGAHTHNFHAIVDLMEEAGAIVQLPPAQGADASEEFTRAVEKLLCGRERARGIRPPRETTRREQPGRGRENDETHRAALLRETAREFSLRFNVACKRSHLMKSIVLPPLSLLYGAITRTRLSLYRRGTFHTTKLERPVISVGNITTGGTGKTPLVEWVSRKLAAKGKKVCILTRGYGRKDPHLQVIVSDGYGVLASPSEAGDEPYLLATSLTGQAAVISSADRIAAGQEAIKDFGTDCFVLDDGFQHLRLARDLNIVTIDATNPWGGGTLLPYGRLREKPEGTEQS